MDIPINAEVMCGGASCGTAAGVIVEPINEQITHFVVKESGFPHIERLVSLKHILKTDSESIVLDCAPEELTGMEQFVEYEYVRGESPYFNYGSNDFWMTPLSLMQLEHERVPAGELAVHHGAAVFAADGRAGKIDDFLIESKTSGRITHIVLREGHLWGAKNVTVPVSVIKNIDGEGVHLNLSRAEIESLPSLKASGWFD